MRRKDRQRRIKAKIKGVAKRPRISVFRSLTRITAQAVDDVKGHIVARAEDKDSVQVGKNLAKILLDKKIQTVVFDRSGYKYHGKVKALAESLRKEGLKF